LPKIYRSMLVDDGMPKTGASGKMLGVRVPPLPGKARPDVTPDEHEVVQPKTGGMSVQRNWRDLPTHLIPKRLNSVVTDAAGRNDLHCWVLGVGAFIDGAISDSLTMRVDNQTEGHGLVEPIQPMRIDRFQDELAATRPHWRIDEE